MQIPPAVTAATDEKKKLPWPKGPSPARPAASSKGQIPERNTQDLLLTRKSGLPPWVPSSRMRPPQSSWRGQRAHTDAARLRSVKKNHPGFQVKAWRLRVVARSSTPRRSSLDGSSIGEQRQSSVTMRSDVSTGQAGRNSLRRCAGCGRQLPSARWQWTTPRNRLLARLLTVLNRSQHVVIDTRHLVVERAGRSPPRVRMRDALVCACDHFYLPSQYEHDCSSALKELHRWPARRSPRCTVEDIIVLRSMTGAIRAA